GLAGAGRADDADPVVQAERAREEGGLVAGEAVDPVGVLGGGGTELLGGGEGFRLVERLGVRGQGRGEERDGDVGVGAGQRRVASVARGGRGRVRAVASRLPTRARGPAPWRPWERRPRCAVAGRSAG